MRSSSKVTTMRGDRAVLRDEVAAQQADRPAHGRGRALPHRCLTIVSSSSGCTSMPPSSSGTSAGGCATMFAVARLCTRSTALDALDVAGDLADELESFGCEQPVATAAR